MIKVISALTRLEPRQKSDEPVLDELTSQLSKSIKTLLRRLALSERGFDTHILYSSLYPPGIGAPTPSNVWAVKIDLPNGGAVYVTSTGKIADQANVDNNDEPLRPKAYLRRYGSNNGELDVKDSFLQELFKAITDYAS